MQHTLEHTVPSVGILWPSPGGPRTFDQLDVFVGDVLPELGHFVHIHWLRAIVIRQLDLDLGLLQDAEELVVHVDQNVAGSKQRAITTITKIAT